MTVPEPAGCTEVAGLLRAGALAVLPTDTVYGLAVHPETPDGVARICAAKGRPETQPIAWLLDAPERLGDYLGRLTGVAKRLALRHWPGPLTLVLRTPSGWEGFRVPDHAVACAVIAAAGGALRVTSANRSGEPPARSVAEARAVLGEAVAIAVDAGRLEGRAVSTVVRVDGEQMEVLRVGQIPASELENRT